MISGFTCYFVVVQHSARHCTDAVREMDGVLLEKRGRNNIESYKSVIT